MEKSAFLNFKPIPNDEVVGLKDAQKELLSLLESFHSFCIDNGIHYSLAYGSLLGAIRNKGIIPWDDDIDIMMTAENFALLKNKLEFYPKKIMDYMHFDNTKHLYTNEIRICSRKMYMLVTDNKHNYLTPLCIDIFPLRLISNNHNKDIDRCLRSIERDKKLLILKESKYESKSLFRYYMRRVKTFCLFFISEKYLHNRIEKKLNLIERLSKNKNCSFFSPNSSSFRTKYQINWFKQYSIINFDGVQTMVCSEAKTILDMIYPNWETPVDKHQGKSNLFKFIIRK